MLAKLLGIIGVVSAGALGYILITTSPVEAGATGVLAVFLLSYIVSVIVLTFLFYLTQKALVKLLYSDRTGSVVGHVSLRKSYYYGSILALGPVILVSLRSVGEAGVGELILVLVLLAIGCLYISRQTS